MKKLIYLTNARIPTEKAHGLQICKTCEAFADLDTKVLLCHPSRKLSKPDQPKENPHKYYGIKNNFQIKRLANLDIFTIERYLPKKIFSVFFTLHAFLWSLFAAIKTRGEKADIYYTRDITLVFWLTLLKMPTVFEVHAAPDRLQKILLPCISKMQTFKALILMSAFLKPLYDKNPLYANKIIMSHHGFSPELFKDLPEMKACRQKLGLPVDKKIMGYIGRFKSVGTDKGITKLIEMMTFPEVKNSTNPLLMCVGGPLNTVPGYTLHAQKKKIPEDQILFFDHIPNTEIPFWICSCDVVLLPLTLDFMEKIGTMPLKLFEYMAAGVPIVATDLPSLREFLKHNKNAVLVEPDSPAAMAKGIHEILSDPEKGKALSNRARQDINKYTWKFKAAKILKALNL